jgi:hypothetical protein
VPQERQGSTEPAVEEIRPPARESPLEGCWVLGELAANSVRRLALGELAANLGGAWRLVSCGPCGWRTRVRRTPLGAAAGWRVAGDWRAPAAELGYAVRHWRWRLATGVATSERRLPAGEVATGEWRLTKWRGRLASGDRRPAKWRLAVANLGFSAVVRWRLVRALLSTAWLPALWPVGYSI